MWTTFDEARRVYICECGRNKYSTCKVSRGGKIRKDERGGSPAGDRPHGYDGEEKQCPR